MDQRVGEVNLEPDVKSPLFIHIARKMIIGLLVFKFKKLLLVLLDLFEEQVKLALCGIEFIVNACDLLFLLLYFEVFLCDQLLEVVKAREILLFAFT